MEDQALYNHFIKFFSELENRVAGKVIAQLLEHPNAVVGTPTTYEKFLKPKEVCEVLNISLSQFYKIKKAHKNFPVCNVGGAKRYNAGEIEQFIKNLKQ
jgi:predicted DNA-binding transcriptional regulator AlpA